MHFYLHLNLREFACHAFDMLKMLFAKMHAFKTTAVNCKSVVSICLAKLCQFYAKSASNNWAFFIWVNELWFFACYVYALECFLSILWFY